MYWFGFHAMFATVASTLSLALNLTVLALLTFQSVDLKYVAYHIALWPLLLMALSYPIFVPCHGKTRKSVVARRWPAESHQLQFAETATVTRRLHGATNRSDNCCVDELQQCSHRLFSTCNHCSEYVSLSQLQQCISYILIIRCVVLESILLDFDSGSDLNWKDLDLE